MTTYSKFIEGKTRLRAKCVLGFVFSVKYITKAIFSLWSYKPTNVMVLTFGIFRKNLQWKNNEKNKFLRLNKCTYVPMNCNSFFSSQVSFSLFPDNNKLNTCGCNNVNRQLKHMYLRFQCVWIEPSLHLNC